MKRVANGMLIVMCLVTAASVSFAQGQGGGDGRGRGQGGPGRGGPACENLQCDMLADWANTRNLIIDLANAMPDDKFGFKPTQPQQSFAERLMHIAQVDSKLLAGLGAKTPVPAINVSATTKPDVIAALNQSFAYGEAVLKEFSEQQLLERVKPMPFLGPSASRARIISYDLQHTQDIYGQLVVYLRLNGITPPASRRGGV